MAIHTADDFFLDELKDIYSAEKQAIRAYPRMTKAVSSDELKQALQTHLEESKGQVERLERVFEMLEKRGGGKTCEGMKGLLEESSEALEEVPSGALLDAAVIASAQRAEHYEIAAYGTVIALAKAMGHQEIADLLAQTLEEEKATDQKLTQISEQVNREAIGGEEEDESEEGDESEDDDEDLEIEDDEDDDEEDEESDDDFEDVETDVEGEEDEDDDEEDEDEDEEDQVPARKTASKSSPKAAGKTAAKPTGKTAASKTPAKTAGKTAAKTAGKGSRGA